MDARPRTLTFFALGLVAFFALAGAAAAPGAAAAAGLGIFFLITFFLGLVAFLVAFFLGAFFAPSPSL